MSNVDLSYRPVFTFILIVSFTTLSIVSYIILSSLLRMYYIKTILSIGNNSYTLVCTILSKLPLTASIKSNNICDKTYLTRGWRNQAFTGYL